MSTRNKAGTSTASQCYCTALRKASRRISQMYDDALGTSGLKITQRSILGQLGRGGPFSIKALAEDLVMEAGGLAHSLKLLERDGFVRMDADPLDRRSRLVVLTQIGQAKLKETEASWNAAQRSLEAAFGQEQAIALRHAMELLSGIRFSEGFDRG